MKTNHDTIPTTLTGQVSKPDERNVMKIIVRIVLVLVLLVIVNHLIHAQWRGIEVTQVMDVNFRPSSISIAKADKDEWNDIILSPTAADNFLHVLPGNPSGKFGAPIVTDRDVNYTLTAAGDFDNDGIDDLVISSYWSNGFRLYRGREDGKYSGSTYYSLTGHGKRVAVADLNKDGKPDVAAISGGSGQPITIHIFYGDHQGNLHLNGVYASVLHTDTSMKFIDKNEDGLTDIMVTSSFPWFMIYYQTPDGKFTPQYWPIKDDIRLPYPRYDVADLNSDGQPDIIAAYTPFGFDSFGMEFYPGVSDTTFSKTFIPLSYDGIKSGTIKIADLNNDGHQDLILNHMTNEENYTDSLYYRLGNGNFTFGEPVLIKFPSPVNNWIVADANNDEFPDIVAWCEGKQMAIALNGNVVTGDKDVAQQPVYAYPNPFIHELRIAATTYPATISVHSLSGVVVQSGTIASETKLDSSTWVSGLYVVKISSADDNATIKVVRY